MCSNSKTSVIEHKGFKYRYLMFKLLKEDIYRCKSDRLITQIDHPNIMPLEFVFHDKEKIYYLVK